MEIFRLEREKVLKKKKKQLSTVAFFLIILVFCMPFVIKLVMVSQSADLHIRNYVCYSVSNVSIIQQMTNKLLITSPKASN